MRPLKLTCCGSKGSPLKVFCKVRQFQDEKSSVVSSSLAVTVMVSCRCWYSLGYMLLVLWCWYFLPLPLPLPLCLGGFFQIVVILLEMRGSCA